MIGIANRRFVMMGSLMLALGGCGGVGVSELDSGATPDAGTTDSSTDGAPSDAPRTDAAMVDGGTLPDEDAAIVDEDADVVDEDAAIIVDEDAAVPEVDAAVPADDAAVPEEDAGTKGSDAGPIEMDAGPIEMDAGPIETDAGPIPTDAGPTIMPVINEYVFQTQAVAGGTVNEWESIEIFGAPSTDYSSLTILLVSGNSTSPGRINVAIPVGTTDANGYWLFDAPDASMDVLSNSSGTLLLVSGFTGAALGDIDSDNDGVIDATAPFTAIIDSVGIRDADVADFVYSSAALERTTPLGTGNVSCASRIPNGVDTDTAADWVRNDLAGAGLPGGPATASAGEAIHSPGAPNHVMP